MPASSAAWMRAIERARSRAALDRHRHPTEADRADGLLADGALLHEVASRSRRGRVSSAPARAPRTGTSSSAPTGRMRRDARHDHRRRHRGRPARRRGRAPGRRSAWPGRRTAPGWLTATRCWPARGDGVDAVRRVLEALRAAAGSGGRARDATALVARRGARPVVLGRRGRATACCTAAPTEPRPWSGRPPAASTPRTVPRDRPAGPAGRRAGAGAADDPADPAEPVRPDGHLRPGWADDGPPTAGGGGPLGCGRAGRAGRARSGTLGCCRTPGAPPGTPALALLTAWSESAAELLAVELGVRRAAAGPRRRRAADRGTGRPATRRRRGRGSGPRQPGRRGPRPGARGRGRRPAQPGPGSGPARPGRHRRARHPVLAAGAVPRHPPAGRRRCSTGARPSGSPRPTATAGWTATSGRTAGCAASWTRLRRRGRPDDRVRRAAQPAGRAAPGGRRRAGACCSSAPTSARSSRGCWPPSPATTRWRGRPATTTCTPRSPPGWRVDRPTAKVAVLAAMYGQTSGAAGEALRGLERAYPVAMGYLRAAHESGGRRSRRHDVRRSAGPDVAAGRAGGPRGDGGPRPVRAATPWCRAPPPSCSRCGRCRCAPRLPRRSARSCSACTTSCWCTRPSRRPTGSAALLHDVLGATAARWAAGSGVRFVADVSVVRRWSEAKG